MAKYTQSFASRFNKKLFVPVTLLPALLILGGYTYFPALYSVVLSLFRTRLFSPVSFIGVNHYIEVFRDSLFWQGVWNTVVYSFWAIVGSIVLGLLLALLLHSKLRGKAFFRTAFFAPYIIPVAASTLLWYWLYDPRYGLVNIVLGWFSIPAIPWITSRSWVIPAFVILDIWKRAGFNMVIFVSGLTTIPEELYDSGLVDGANVFQRFFHITLPMLKPVTLFAVVMAFLHTFQLFTEPYVMTKGGPGNASISVVYQIYVTGFRNMNVGRGSAIAVILFVIIFIITFIMIRKYDAREI